MGDIGFGMGARECDRQNVKLLCLKIPALTTCCQCVRILSLRSVDVAFEVICMALSVALVLAHLRLKGLNGDYRYSVKSL